MTDIGIGRIACVAPDRLVPTASLDEYPDLDPAAREFVDGSGIETIGDVGEVTGAELAASAVDALGVDGADALILVGPRAPDVLLGSDAARVQHLAKLDGAFAFTLDGLGCTGSSSAWALAADLLRADASRERIVVAHASRPTGADRVRPPVTVIGDGACAMTLVRGGRPVLRAHRQRVDGAFNDLFTVDYRQTPWYEWREECADPDRYRFELAMHSRLQLSELVDGVLADVGAAKGDVRATLMQNVTASAFDFYESLLGLPIHRVCRDNLRRYGHQGAMDVVANLDALLSSGDVSPGDLVLVMNNSPVAAWAATLWEV